LKRADYRSRRDELIKRFDLEPYLHTPIRKLSLGERMRCEIVATLLHRPKIIFLDEPTIGLDVIVKQKIRKFILEMNREEGTTIFLTSHDAGDIEKLCQRVRLEEQVDDYVETGVKVLQSGSILKLSIDTTVKPIEEVLTGILNKYKVLDVNIEDPPMEEIITHIYERGESQ